MKPTNLVIKISLKTYLGSSTQEGGAKKLTEMKCFVMKCFVIIFIENPVIRGCLDIQTKEKLECWRLE